MKKFYFILVTLMVTTFICNAQTTNRVYCELLGVNKPLSTKCTVTIDYGQEVKLGNDTRLVDSDGKPITFNSMVDAMNYMGTMGWKFETAYVVTTANQNIYHWLLSKDIDNNENINDGFTTKTEFNKQNK